MRLRLVTRVGPDVSHAAPYVLGSLAAHVLFVAAIVLLPSLRPRRPMLDTPLFVDLVAPAPGPATVEATAPAPAPPPQPTDEAPSPEGVRAETRVPEPKPTPEPPPKPPRKPPEPRVQPKPATTSSTGPSGDEPSKSPSPASGPGGAAGASITALEGVADLELGWYKGQVTAALYQAWRKPVLDRIREAREVRVSFEIRRDGSVSGLQVTQTSGVPSLDRSALRAVSDALPLPPLPPNWREPKLSAVFVFRLHPE